ncbi:MAG: hypothetical protein IJD54_01715 [Clostridia bacterium]|nr:hypothetical protein [Clostridia bacterium]
MKIIAHRSGPNVYPEQTITSASFALYCGADMVEVDVRYTLDKKIAASHDANTLRVFGQDKLVKDMTEKEFLSLRHTTDVSFGSHLFEHYLMRKIAPILIHVKEDELIDDLIALLKKYDYLDKVTFGVMSVNAVNKIKAVDKTLPVLAFMPKVQDIVEFVKAGADYIRLWEDWTNDDTVKTVKNSGAKLWIMTGKITDKDSDVGVSTQDGLKKLISYDVDGILINDITILQDVLQEIEQD